MKKLLLLFSIFFFSYGSISQDAIHPKHPGNKTGKIVGLTAVQGLKAQAIFEALNADIVTKNTSRASVDTKKIASFRCMRIYRKMTSTLLYRCVLKGKDITPKKLRGRKEHRKRKRHNHKVMI